MIGEALRGVSLTPHCRKPRPQGAEDGLRIDAPFMSRVTR